MAKARMDSPHLGPVGGVTHAEKVSPLDGRVISDGSVYVSLRARLGDQLQRQYAVHPTSIWMLPRDSLQIQLRDVVGDEGQLRANSFMGGKWLPSERYGTSGSSRAAASVFNPSLAAMLVKAYSLPDHLVIDPFAGGGTRAVVTAMMGRRYCGVDVRPDEVQRVNARLEALGFGSEVGVLPFDAAMVDWRLILGPERADALITCPPYWNLEVYSDDPADLSTAPSYPEFLGGLRNVINRTRFGLKNGAYVIWVCGEFRDPTTNELLDFPGDVLRLHQEQKFWLYDRIVYSHANPQALWRMGMFDKTRKSVRVHEHVLVMKYGGRERVRARRPDLRARGADYWNEP